MLLPFSRPKAIVEWWLYVRMIYDDPLAFDLLRMQHAGFPSCLRFSTAGIRARGINSSIKLTYSGRSATRNRSQSVNGRISPRSRQRMRWPAGSTDCLRFSFVGSRRKKSRKLRSPARCASGPNIRSKHNRHSNMLRDRQTERRRSART